MALENVSHYPLQSRSFLAHMLSGADIVVVSQVAEVIDIVVPSKLLTAMASGAMIVAAASRGVARAHTHGRAMSRGRQAVTRRGQPMVTCRRVPAARHRGPAARGHAMARRRRHTPEQIIRKLREADRLLAEGQQVPEVAKALEVSEQTFHRSRTQYGGMKAEDARRLKELERENAQLKRIVADQLLENQALREIAKGNF